MTDGTQQAAARTLRVALAQILSGTDPTVNLDLVEAAIRRAYAAEADVVVLPEATMCCFGVPLRGIAEPLDGPWAARVRDLVAATPVTVVTGMFTPAGERIRNTLLVTGPGVEASYDKIHLFDAYGFRESDTVEAGTKVVTVDVPLRGGGRAVVGLTTCYDIRFPALFQALGDAGAELIACPSSWGAGPGKVDQWRVLAAARAMDATAYVVACGQADPGSEGRPATRAPTGVGHSLVTSPRGATCVELGPAPEFAVVDLDLDAVATCRRDLPVLANRRRFEPPGGPK